MVRCAQNRSESRYDQECVNARQAVDIIEARQAAARRAELELLSESKRQALRKTREAVDAARRQAEENRRRQEEAEYLALFGAAPTAEGDAGEAVTSGNTPQAVIPPPEESLELRREDEDIIYVVPDMKQSPMEAQNGTEPSPGNDNSRR